MPHGKKQLNSCDRNDIRAWIREGAKDNWSPDFGAMPARRGARSCACADVQSSPFVLDHLIEATTLDSATSQIGNFRIPSDLWIGVEAARGQWDILFKIHDCKLA
jgi:hypothetical protein